MALVDRFDVDIGGADQAEPFFIWNDEHDTLVVVLQNVGVLLIVHTRHDDMTAFHQFQRGAHRYMYSGVKKLLHPGARRIHDAAGIDERLFTGIDIEQVDLPHITGAFSIDHTGSSSNFCAVLASGNGVEHGEAGVVDACVGIKKSALDGILEAGAILLVRK